MRRRKNGKMRTITPVLGTIDMEYTEIAELTLMALRARVIVDEGMASSFAIPVQVAVERIADYAYRQLAVEIRQQVYGRQLETITASYPADWWQALKDRWFPAWALKRWPVRLHTITLTITELYPKLAAPGYAESVAFAKCERMDDYTWRNHPVIS
jgi:hypothetical protein